VSVSPRGCRAQPEGAPAINLDGSPLPPSLSERVLSALGFSEPPLPDLAGRTSLYLAQCMRVPFDNTRKIVALRAGAAGASD
jgi:hypothetical protein